MGKTRTPSGWKENRAGRFEADGLRQRPHGSIIQLEYKTIRKQYFRAVQSQGKGRGLTRPSREMDSLLQYLDLGFLSVLPDGFDAVLGARLGGIAVGREDDVSVHGLEPEAELALVVLVDLVLGVCEDLVAIDSLILDQGVAVEPYRFDSVLRGLGAAIGLGSPYDRSVACNKAEDKPVLLLGGIHNEFCHGG